MNIPVNTTAFQRFGNLHVMQGGLSNNAGAFQPLEVHGNCSSWMLELSDRFEDITSLRPGWDGYLGRPVSFSCATFAASLIETVCVDGIPAPSVVPGSDGTLQLEWHLNGYDIEIDILGANRVVATRFVHASELEDTVELNNDFSIVADWIEQLGILQHDDLAVNA